MSHPPLLVDAHGRVMRDLRVSVTDRCNFRCMYCLPETEAAENFYRDRWATVVNPTPISRRLEFIRLNLFGSSGKGGAEKLMTPANKAPAPANKGTNFGLEVEVRPDGGAKVVSPTPAPAPTPPK